MVRGSLRSHLTMRRHASGVPGPWFDKLTMRVGVGHAFAPKGPHLASTHPKDLTLSLSKGEVLGKANRHGRT
jgi:hypothetical protein